MSNKISLNCSKTLKLSNILIFEVAPSEDLNIGVEINRMENYIKSKGYQPIGPLVQYAKTRISEGGLEIIIKFLRQSSGFINNIDPPYTMEPVLRIRDCMYVRFAGEESKMGFAYDKIKLTAFEEDIELKGDSYTVFVDRVDDNIVADVFMEKKHD